MNQVPLSLILEFARAAQAGDPFAFRFVPQDYLLRGEGGVFANAVFPWDAGLLADLEAVRRPGRDPALVARVGEVLRHFLEPAGWAEYERRIEFAQREQHQIVLTVRSAAAELYALPWELLTLRSSGQHLGELTGLLLRYEWPELLPAPVVTPSSQQQRILLAWSAAGGAVPADEQLSAIQAACQQGGLAFDAMTNVVPQASCGRLVSALEAASKTKEPVAVLHLLCHGSAVGTTFGLSFDPEQPGGDRNVVDAGQLRQLLAPYASTLRLVVLCACDSGNVGALGNQLGSLAQTLHRAGIASVIASRYPLSVSGSIRLSEVLYQKLLGETQSLESALLAARRRIAEDPAQLDWASLQLYARAQYGEDTRPVLFRPFRGLLAFQAQHQRFYFGREEEIGEICRRLSALAASNKPRLLIVAGASGTGKSSLVLAGVVPRLLQEQAVPVRIARMRPGSTPLLALETALATANKGNGPLLLVIDQFEEVFTHVSNEETRQSFARKLWELATHRDSEPPTSLVMSLRVDFIGRCGELILTDSGLSLDRLAYDDAHRVFLSRLAVEQLRAVITEPAARVGLALEEGLASRILNELGTEPGALPILEHTLDILWQRRQGRFLTQQAYDEMGGVTGALKGHADALIDSLAEAEQRTAQRLLVRLVDRSAGQDAALGTRLRVPTRTLRPPTAKDAMLFDSVVARLVEARLLVSDDAGPEPLIEVAHEALIRTWPRLHRWVRESSTKLAALDEFNGWLRQWREHGVLLVGQQLAHAELFAKLCEDELAPDAQQLLRESRARQKTSRRFSLFLRGLLGLAILLTSGFLLLILTGGYAGVEAIVFFVYILLVLGVFFLPIAAIGYGSFLLWRWLRQTLSDRAAKQAASTRTQSTVPNPTERL